MRTTLGDIDCTLTPRCPPGSVLRQQDFKEWRRELTLPDASELRFFDGFAWAVPTAFASALAALRFEQGDVVYRDPTAYGPLAGTIASDCLAIQVLHPPRSARSMPVDVEGDRRLANWQSAVRIELIDLASGTREARTISQGKLLTTLWRGDEAWLDADADEPPLPKHARDLAQVLPNNVEAFGRVQSTSHGCRFIFVVDLASDASRVKAQAMEEALGALGPVERVDLSPASAGVESAETYHPALALRGLASLGARFESAQAALKKCLYSAQAEVVETAESADEETPSKTKADRFSLARHGVLEAIGD
jgi:hypothetical protein